MPDGKQITETTEGFGGEGPVDLGRGLIDDAEQRKVRALKRRKRKTGKRGDETPPPVISVPSETKERKKLSDEEQLLLADRRKESETVGLIGTLKHFIAQIRGKEKGVLKTPQSHSARI